MADYPLLPEGVYSCEVIKFDPNAVSGNGNPMWKAQFLATHSGKHYMIFENFPQHEKMLWRREEFLKALNIPYNAEVPPLERQLLGRTFRVMTKHEEWKEKGTVQSKVKKFLAPAVGMPAHTEVSPPPANYDDFKQDEEIPF